MRDKEFKKHLHNCEQYVVHSRGEAVSPKYHPDIVLAWDNQYIIVEHESKPSRKTIVADVFKAALFLQGQKSGYIVIVLTPRGKSIHSYLRNVSECFYWLRERTNLTSVVFIHEEHYFQNGIPVQIGCTYFVENCITLSVVN